MEDEPRNSSHGEHGLGCVFLCRRVPCNSLVPTSSFSTMESSNTNSVASNDEAFHLMSKIAGWSGWTRRIRPEISMSTAESELDNQMCSTYHSEALWTSFFLEDPHRFPMNWSSEITDLKYIRMISYASPVATEPRSTTRRHIWFFRRNSILKAIANRFPRFTLA